ncbi:MAG: universal stress protein, partial [Rhodospirillaceae bacterium]
MPGIRTVMAIMSDAQSGEAPLRVALQVAQSLDCFLEAYHVRADPSQAVPYVGEAMGGSMVEDMVSSADKEAHDLAKQTRALFDAKVAEAGLSQDPITPAPGATGARWVEEPGVECDSVALRGRVADLIVMGRPGQKGAPPSLMTLNAALMESGRPVLVAPPQPVDAVGSSIVVGWNGSAEAARAIVDAIPFMAQAKQVTILLAEESEATSEPTALMEHLAWHGIQAQTRILVAPPGSRTGEALLKAAEEVSADLLVMGAYTHSRLRQLILGGVTRYVLERATLPVLF